MISPMSESEFLEQYIKFQKELTKREEELPRKHKIQDPADRMDLFRFWFADRRDQEMLAIQEKAYKRERRREGDAWFDTGDEEDE